MASLANQTQLTHMQSFNQIARGGDKRSGKNKIKNTKKGTLNLWLTESCEGTLKSPPKSFKLGHVALAFVTSIADAVELEVREEISQKEKKNKLKNGLLIVVDYYCRQILSHIKCQEKKWHQYNSQGLGVINDV